MPAGFPGHHSRRDSADTAVADLKLFTIRRRYGGLAGLWRIRCCEVSRFHGRMAVGAIVLGLAWIGAIHPRLIK